MLKLQKFIKDNPLDWEEKLKNDPYNIAIKHDLGCVIFNYNLFSSDFSNPIVKECRGVILYEEDFEVAALSFYKFFNYGQEFADDIDWGSARVQTKVDGSISRAWHHRTLGWVVSTNSVIDGEKSQTCSPHVTQSTILVSFKDLFMEGAQKQGLDFSTLNPDYTYTFEIVSPQNRQVIDYPTTEIWHIGTRNNKTLEELNVDIGIQKPQEWAFNSIYDVVMTAAKFRDEQEGFVVVDKYWHRVKVKSPYYVLASHYFNDDMALNKLIQIFLSGDYEEFLVAFPKYRPLMKVMNNYVENVKIKEIKEALAGLTKEDLELSKFDFFKKTQCFSDSCCKYLNNYYQYKHGFCDEIMSVREFVMKIPALQREIKKMIRSSDVVSDISDKPEELKI